MQVWPISFAIINKLHFSLFFLPNKPSHMCPLFSISNSCSNFQCYIMHVCIWYIYNVLILYNIIFMYAFRDDIFVFFEEDNFSYSQSLLVDCSLLCRIEVLWVFSHPLWHIYWNHHCSSCVQAVMLMRLMGIASDIARRHNFIWNYLIWFIWLFASLLQCFLIL